MFSRANDDIREQCLLAAFVAAADSLSYSTQEGKKFLKLTSYCQSDELCPLLALKKIHRAGFCSSLNSSQSGATRFTLMELLWIGMVTQIRICPHFSGDSLSPSVFYPYMQQGKWHLIATK